MSSIFRASLNKNQIKMAKKWIKALRSGKYKQGRNALRPEEDRYCCLGVLCDVVDHKGWDHVDRFEHHGVGGAPREQVLSKVGLLETVYLVTLNDVGRTSAKTGKLRKIGFRGIAQVLERELEART